MVQRQEWVNHKFNLGIDIGWTPNILSRTNDTALRLQYHCKDLNNEQLSFSMNDKWSIKEQIGHLIDLEELWRNRFQDYPKRSKVLLIADMSNQKTNQANHNNKSIEELLDQFVKERKKTLKTFNQLDEKSHDHQALHPRLKVPMRPVDLLFFIAEHDDHHITSILQLKREL